MIINNKKVVDYLCSKWDIQEQNIYRIYIHFENSHISLYDNYNNFVSSYNLTKQRMKSLEEYINR